MNPSHRILLIRPWDMPDGVGAGCCSGGSTKGLCVASPEDTDHTGHTEQRENPVHTGTPAAERVGWEPFADVYLRLRESLPDDAALEVVDPRNHLYLLPVLIQDARRRGLGWREAVRDALRKPGYAAIVVDGLTVSSGQLPTPDQAVAAVRAALAGR
jgi:hypothetical protein